MILYTPEMFDVENLKTTLHPLFMEQETLEFQISVFQEKFDLLLTLHYKDLLVYERKKEKNASLMPNIHILQQLKQLEDDESVTEFRQILGVLKRDLNIVNGHIDKETFVLNTMFAFRSFNVDRYLNNLILYYDGFLNFDDVMKDIFNNEFNDANIYESVHTLRTHNIINMLVLRSPVDWKDFARLIVDESKYVFALEDLMTESPEEVDDFIIAESHKRENRFEYAKRKQTSIANAKKNTLLDRKALDLKFENRPRIISEEFIQSRIDRHKEIIEETQSLSIARTDLISKKALDMINPENKWTQ